MSLEIALEKIRKEAEERTGFLDIGNLGLDEIPEELFELTHLKTLVLNRSTSKSAWRVDARSAEVEYAHSEKSRPNRFRADDPRLSRLVLLETFLNIGGILSDLRHLAKHSALRHLDCTYTQVADLGPLANLQSLASLDCSSTQVADLGPLANLQSLASLVCSSTQVADLGPLANLQSLASLRCSHTQVADLSPVANLQSLASLVCSSTQVADLGPLANLQSLASLRCSHTQVADLGPLANLRSLVSLNCSHTQVTDLGPLANLQSLASLNCSSTQVTNLGPLANLQSLASLYCSHTQVTDLGPLANLQSLASLYCSYTQVTNLGPLANLQSLASLYCSRTQVTDLGPLANLQSLASLYCYETRVTDLGPLANLQSLASLNCYETQVTDLSPLANLQSLASLDCSNTQVAVLGPLANLQSLASLYCSDTQVTDLGPLANLQSLTSFDCSDTQVAVLGPLANLQSLASLYCSDTQVKSLNALFKSGSISTINAFNCPISHLGDATAHSKLSNLVVGGEACLLGGIPPEVLSQSEYENCLNRLREHFDDLGDSPQQFNHIKVFLLGNGRIGKTQIARRLRHLPFDPLLPSTHGIEINPETFPVQIGKEATLNIWDFGGQDIYHGTHALFLKSRAIFIIVWTPESETGASSDPDGTEYSHETLSYWLDYVAKLGGAKSPLIILQNQCDDGKKWVAENELPLSPESKRFLAEEKTKREISVVGYSAKDDSYREKFQMALKTSILALWDISHPKIGRSRLGLWENLQNLRLNGVEPKLAWDDYLRKVEEFGVTGAEGFAEILHNAGMVFWKPDLFDRSLILNQDWCLQAIYTVLTRGAVLQKVHAQNGIFTREDLDSWVWREAGYTPGEQRQFLQMMESCGICFSVGGHHDDTKYIAPELLNKRGETAVVHMWDHIPEKEEEISFHFSFLAPGISRVVLAELGKLAGRNAAYWKHGLFFWGEDGTAVMIEEVLDKKSDSRAGSIILRTKGEPHSTLRDHLGSLLEDILDKQPVAPKVTASSKWIRRKFGSEKERLIAPLPPHSELPWNNERVRNAMRPRGWKNVYVVGSLDRRITFYSQQVRALRLVRALAEQDGWENKKIAIIGGGVAGITTAVAAARTGCRSVTVFEEKSQILQLQARANHRYIHPHIYQWPADGSHCKDAGLPLMDWSADYADKVVLALHDELDRSGYVSQDEDDNKPVRIRREICIESFRERHDKVDLYLKTCFCPEECDLVIITSGFGLEAEKPKDVPCESYWRPDSLEGPFSSHNRERILVSGIGDGGLIDVVRAAIHTGGTTYGPHVFQHAEAVRKLCDGKQFQQLGKLLEDVDQRYRMSEQTGTGSYDLRKHYHAVFRTYQYKDELKKAMNRMRRQDTEVWFNYQRADDVFNLNSALLNRVLILLLIECGIIHPLRGRIDKCVREQDLYAVRMKARDAYEDQRFNRVILRFGPAKDYLAKRFDAELRGSTDELRKKGLLFPITKLDPATKSFYEKAGKKAGKS